MATYLAQKPALSSLVFLQHFKRALLWIFLFESRLMDSSENMRKKKILAEPL